MSTETRTIMIAHPLAHTPKNDQGAIDGARLERIARARETALDRIRNAAANRLFGLRLWALEADERAAFRRIARIRRKRARMVAQRIAAPGGRRCR